ncbi:uncharacterized protein BDR25DRAFT_351684 [Lindgomyces ingoldianus]|uniref:Uncharacterized protein n=1 Tax=Lindgomyces ingoldianus TaxID=673940 RepID=A0ACB6R4B2_9PLEO|nr:uncharacterized protein BDR25DRAFT_351684 [Lindgomyces ingoldianus]KAF2474154.1 hypothetical protein BDR25DRAFT_351684 [Lindgomyces ingoldianus]
MFEKMIVQSCTPRSKSQAMWAAAFKLHCHLSRRWMEFSRGMVQAQPKLLDIVEHTLSYRLELPLRKTNADILQQISRLIHILRPVLEISSCMQRTFEVQESLFPIWLACWYHSIALGLGLPSRGRRGNRETWNTGNPIASLLGPLAIIAITPGMDLSKRLVLPLPLRMVSNFDKSHTCKKGLSPSGLSLYPRMNEKVSSFCRLCMGNSIAFLRRDSHGQVLTCHYEEIMSKLFGMVYGRYGILFLKALANIPGTYHYRSSLSELTNSQFSFIIQSCY